jgi:hypothetical protein
MKKTLPYFVVLALATHARTVFASVFGQDDGMINDCGMVKVLEQIISQLARLSVPFVIVGIAVAFLILGMKTRSYFLGRSSKSIESQKKPRERCTPPEIRVP